MPKLIDSEKAFEVHKKAIEIKNGMGFFIVRMGQLLKEIRDNDYYEVLGYETFSEYVANSELAFKRRTAYYYIEIYEWFILKFDYKPEELAEIGYSKLITLLPIVKKTESLPEPRKRVELLVDDVKALRPYDFKKKYKDEKKQKDFRDILPPPEYFRCECHGKWKFMLDLNEVCPKYLEELYYKLKQKFDK